MSHVAKNLRLNKFQRVYLPKNRELFMRYGFKSCSDGFSSDGDRSVPVVMSQSKLDSIASGQKVVTDGYNQFLNEKQMPSDTDTSKTTDVASPEQKIDSGNS